MKRLAVQTSGGDAPGVNAAIRAVMRTAARGIAVDGVYNGFAGLVDGQFETLDDRAVGGIVQRGGTILGSRRFPAFREEETQQRAIRQLREAVPLAEAIASSSKVTPEMLELANALAR